MTDSVFSKRLRRGACLAGALAAALLAGGCGESAPDNEWHSQHPYTWREWVAREAPKRDGHYTFYHRDKGLPNMENWRPEDFLLPKYFEAEHVDICTIPPEERQPISDLRWADVPIHGMPMRQLLALAEQNHGAAQSHLSVYCFAQTLQVHGDPGLDFTPADALEWTRRAAASGDPLTMRRLADCMTAIDLSVSGGDMEHELDPFWTDQTTYWLWRAATETLEPEAVAKMAPPSRIIEHSYGPNGRDREQAEKYLWLRLWELQSVFRRYTTLNPAFKSRMQRLDGITDEQRRLGEALLADWLRTHPDVWARIYAAPTSPAPGKTSKVFCPGEPSHRQSFDFEALNAALAPYGLRAEPPHD
jgi:hypothetical protein